MQPPAGAELAHPCQWHPAPGCVRRDHPLSGILYQSVYIGVDKLLGEDEAPCRCGAPCALQNHLRMLPRCWGFHGSEPRVLCTAHHRAGCCPSSSAVVIQPTLLLVLQGVVSGKNKQQNLNSSTENVFLSSYCNIFIIPGRNSWRFTNVTL